MTRLTSAIAVVVGTAALMLYAAQTASAAPPTNDTSAAATVVSSLPFTDTVDTTEATTDAEDAALNANCGAPVTEHSVWYAYTSAAGDELIIDVSQSSFSAGIITATGSPGNLTLTGCGPRSVIDNVAAGETTYIMAFDDTAGEGGGTLQISISQAPPPPTVSATIDPIGHVNSRTGVATISGTVTCENGDFVDIEVDLTQRVGRVYVQGSGFSELPCDGTDTWSIDVPGNNGRFAGGKVAAVALSFSCGVLDCADNSTQQNVQLKK